jgi:hypothetical protein
MSLRPAAKSASAHIHAHRQSGEFAITGALAVQAVVRMAGEQKFDNITTDFQDARRMSANGQAFPHRHCAACLKARFTIHFHQANTARSVRRRRHIHRAKMRDMNAGS